MATIPCSLGLPAATLDVHAHMQKCACKLIKDLTYRCHVDVKMFSVVRKMFLFRQMIEIYK